ncbi:hypothetical protein GCM10027059_28540 [Myceligenerans halotolerans]
MLLLDVGPEQVAESRLLGVQVPDQPAPACEPDQEAHAREQQDEQRQQEDDRNAQCERVDAGLGHAFSRTTAVP